MPPPGPDGEVDAASAPEFIAVAGRGDGIAGYVPKRFLLPDPGALTEPPGDMPVYGEDLRTLVGHMVAGKGFVPLGVDPATVPKFPVQVQQGPSFAVPPGRSNSLTMYVRSAIGGTTWLSVLAGSSLVGGQGYNSGLGVGCVDLAVGDRIVLLDRAPQDAGTRILQTVYLRDEETQPSAVSVDIDANRWAAQGVGKPDWWQGDAPAC